MKNTNNVPRLRFPNFTDAWEQRKFGDVGSVSMCKRIFKDETVDEGEIPFYKIGTFGSAPDAYISRELYEEYKGKYSYPYKGDILLSASGTIGRIVEYNGEEAYFQDSNIVWLSHDKTISNLFLKTLYPIVKWNGIEGSTIKRLYNDNFLTTQFMMPALAEQTQIGTFFSTLDTLITLHQRKCDKLEEYKKAMLQKIFSQELRFKREDGTEYPEWEEKRFGTTVLIERGGSPRPIKQYITNGDGYNWVKIGDAPEYGNYITHTAEKIKKSGLNKTRQVFKGDLILSNSMSFGKPYIMAIDGCIHDGWLLIRNNQNIYNLKFLCYLLGTDYMLKQYKSLAGGSTVNNLNKELVSMTTVSVPCLEEQQKIADFLSALDETISYAKQEFDKWKELKKGLLQQMFV